MEEHPTTSMEVPTWLLQEMKPWLQKGSSDLEKFLREHPDVKHALRTSLSAAASRI